MGRVLSNTKDLDLCTERNSVLLRVVNIKFTNVKHVRKEDLTDNLHTSPKSKIGGREY